VAIDVTFAKGPDTPDEESFTLGETIVLGWGPNIHPGLYRALENTAKKLEIPYKMEPMPRHSGTDAMGLQIARAGIPTMVIMIPLRYMHTPGEMISLKDVKRAGRLIAEFISELEADFMQNLSLEEE
jgi:endoglucanase